MLKKKVGLVLFLALVLAGCGKDAAQDNKENVNNMLTIHQHLVKASDEAHLVVQDVVRDFDEKEMSYDTLKNIIKEHQSVQRSLQEGIHAQGTTTFRADVSLLFEGVMQERVNQYDQLLALVRQKDAKALVVLAETLKEKEKETRTSQLVQVNELLEKEKFKKLDALEK